MMKRFICILAITVFIGRAIAQNPLPTVTISASSQQRELTAAMAIEGKMDTRWSSDTNDEKWLAKLEKDLRASLLASIEKVRSRDKLKTLPADALKASFDKYLEDSRYRASQPIGKRSTYTPYEARNIGALIRLGRIKDAQMLLEFFVSDGIRPSNWNHLAEVVHGDLRTPSYIGDMPHTWVGAELINSICDVLVYEDRGRLVLAAGVPDSWLAQSASVRNLQTWWGAISYDLKRQNDGQVVLELRCSKQPTNGFVVPTGVKLIIKNNSEITN
ncbi:MAG: hypothetical protein ABII09_12480 [Planctomycetota bacterium]